MATSLAFTATLLPHNCSLKCHKCRLTGHNDACMKVQWLQNVEFKC